MIILHAIIDLILKNSRIRKYLPPCLLNLPKIVYHSTLSLLGGIQHQYVGRVVQCTAAVHRHPPSTDQYIYRVVQYTATVHRHPPSTEQYLYRVVQYTAAVHRHPPSTEYSIYTG